MSIHATSRLAAAIVLVLAVTTCDDPTRVGPADTNPPVVTTVTPRDIYHVDVTFDEEVTEASAQNDAHYVLAKSGALSAAAHLREFAPGDTLSISAAALQPDKRTVTITTYETMSGLSLSLWISGVADASGNEISAPIEKTFAGSSLVDKVPPQIFSRVPAPGAAGVAVGAPVVIQFSEPLDYQSVYSGVTWTSGSTPVSFYRSMSGATLTLSPRELLPHNAVQTITLADLKDLTGNSMFDSEWSFRTTNTVDDTPPRLVSSSPANGAAHVDVNANISLTFSEAVNQWDFDLEMTPWPGYSAVGWSNEGRTLSIDPEGPLMDNRQYRITVYPQGVEDLSGNSIADFHTIVFTTGSVLDGGSIAGMVTGDPGSAAADPTGALVLAEDTVYVDYYTSVASNNTYKLSYLPDGMFYVLAYLDTNHDGQYDPWSGDAIGGYGVDLAAFDFDLDPVVIVGGRRWTGIDFPIYDPSVMQGTVTYEGAYAAEEHAMFVGLFTVAGFDPSNPGSPVASGGGWWPYADWYMNSIQDLFPDGDYYLFAYIDVNEWTTYEPGIDPAGMYGGFDSPTVLHISNGNDIFDITIPVVDPQAPASSLRIAWPARKHNAGFQRLCDRIQQSQLRATRR